MEIIINKFLHFFLSQYENKSKNIKFDEKKIKKSDFYKYKELFKIDELDFNKILVSKKSHMTRKSHLNSLLDITTMMLLDHYP